MPDHFPPRLVHQVLLDVRVLLGDVHRLLVAVLRIRRHRRIQRNFHPLITVVPHRIQRQVCRYPEQPGGELRARDVIFPRAVHSQKNFLRQVLRLFPVPHHPVQKIDQRTPVAMQQKRERLFVARLHVQHQLDVRPGHSRHTVSNPCSLRKLQYSRAKVRRNYTWNKCRIINKLTTPTNTNSAIRQFGSRFTSGSKSVAATYNVTPPESGSAYFNCPCSELVSNTPAIVATPNNPAARIALRFPCPLASTTDATVNPSGSLCRNTAKNITAPSHVETRNPAAIATPSKKVWIVSPTSTLVRA